MDKQHKIHGQERRELKKKYHEIRRLVDNFWRYEDIDRVYGGGMPDSKCKKFLRKKKREMKKIERKLAL